VSLSEIKNRPAGTLARIRIGVLGILGALSLCGQPAAPPVATRPSGASANPLGFSNEIYSEWTRTSRYLTVRDGTRLAIDYYRPAIKGVPTDRPYPVILDATPYHRAAVKDGKVMDFLVMPSASSALSYPTLFASLLRHGYVIARLDLRGTGASFGTVYGGIPARDQDRWDLYDVIEWLAAQPWSDGNVGMVGCSYRGLTQFLAASVMPPHLKAIVPSSAPLDIYGAMRVNGVNQESFFVAWDQLVRRLEYSVPAPPVDEDTDGSLLRAALQDGCASPRTRAGRDAPVPRHDLGRFATAHPGGGRPALYSFVQRVQRARGRSEEADVHDVGDRGLHLEGVAVRKSRLRAVQRRGRPGRGIGGRGS